MITINVPACLTGGLPGIGPVPILARKPDQHGKSELFFPVTPEARATDLDGQSQFQCLKIEGENTAMPGAAKSISLPVFGQPKRNSAHRP
jgi:hypothetical protein